MTQLIHELPLDTAAAMPDRVALRHGGLELCYAEFAALIDAVASALIATGLGARERVGIYLDKRLEVGPMIFGTARAGGVFVPINPVLKAEQVLYIARDCNVRVLFTTGERFALLAERLHECPDLRAVVVVGGQVDRVATVAVHQWDRWLRDGESSARPLHRAIDADMTAILYTSGSTGKPKGVVLSHRNMVTGARSVASYLGNTAQDRLLAVLPLSFDYGLSQLSTAFSVGACAVLHNYLLPGDVVRELARERITGLAAVPPLWIQLSALQWPEAAGEHLRYFTNSGGAMPTATLAVLRQRMPKAKPYLMYGLTEAFRSTYLPPEEIDRRPLSMGRAIPNAEVMVVREDGSECGPDEPGELVHRGSLVALGYWNDPQKTAERFRPSPGKPRELVLPEIAVWSGDTVRRDADGFLYFVGRRDEMIKTSGYRVSPTEIEEVLYRTGIVSEVAAFGIEHPKLGQAIVVVARPQPGGEADTDRLLDACRESLPAFMMPSRVDWQSDGLPRNPNGKIDRKSLALERASLFAVEEET